MERADGRRLQRQPARRIHRMSREAVWVIRAVALALWRLHSGYALHIIPKPPRNHCFSDSLPSRKVHISGVQIYVDLYLQTMHRVISKPSELMPKLKVELSTKESRQRFSLANRVRLIAGSGIGGCALCALSFV